MESKKENGFADMNIYLDVGQACVVTYAITGYMTFKFVFQRNIFVSSLLRNML